MVRHRVWTALQVILILAVVAITIGQFIGQPVLLAYVTSDSMEPTLSTGDGYVVLPSIVTGPAETGDVIVFHAKTLHGGGGALTTHRVVDKTDHEVITKGDKNSITDQSGGEPPVKQRQIVGQAVLLGRQPVVIPHLGTAFTGIRSSVKSAQRSLSIALGTRALLGTQGLAYLLFGLGGLLYAGSMIAEQDSGPNVRRTRNRRRSRNRRISKRLVGIGLGCLLVVSITITMTVAGGVHDFSVVSAERDVKGPSVIPAGQSEQLNYSVPNGGVIPVVAYIEPANDGEGMKTPKHGIFVPPGERQTVSVELSAPEQTGHYSRPIVEHRYLAVLPQTWIHQLYLLHPWLPVIVIDALVLGVFLSIALPLLGRGTIRPHSTRSSIARRIKRRLRF